MKFRPVLLTLLLTATSVCWSGNFRHYKGLSDAEVQERVERGDADAILELGHRDKRDMLPKLRQMAAQTQPTETELKAYANDDKKVDESNKKRLEIRHERSSRAARMVLAKLGDKEAEEEFLAEAKNDGPQKQQAIAALGYIADRKTAKELIALLDDDRVPDVKHSGHELLSPNSLVAENALAEMFPEVLEQFRKENPGNRFFFKKEWQKWWTKNGDQFEGEK